MKHLIALTAVVVLLVGAAFVQAKGGGPAGTQGTISTVGSKGFEMTTNDGKTVDVLCDSNTKFMSGKDTASAKDIKTGIKVSVQGGVSGKEIMATSVTIVPSKGK